MKRIQTLFLFFWMGLYGFLGAQTTGYQSLKFRNFSMGEGLSMSTILSVVQTQDGYIWFATPDKLNRFDGYSFKTFKHEPGNIKSLSNNFVTALLALPNGELLVATNSDFVDIYNPISQEFRKIRLFSEAHPMQEVRGFSLLDSQQVLVYTMGAGLCQISLVNGKVQWLDLQYQNEPIQYVHCVLKKEPQVVYLGTDRGLFAWNFRKNLLFYDSTIGDMSISALAKINQTLYVGSSNNGLFCLQPESRNGPQKQVVVGEESFMHINFLLADSKNRLWVGSTFDGLMLIDTQGNQSVFRKNLADNFSLINNTVYVGLEDREANIWFGTISGVSAYVPLNQQFKFYRPTPDLQGSLSNKQIYPIYQDLQGNIWIGTLEGGLNLYHPNTQTFTVFNRNNSKGLLSNSIRCIHQDAKKRYWIGTGDRGLFRFYPDKKEFVAVRDEQGKLLVTSPIRTLFYDAFDWLWIGSAEGILAYHPETGKVLRNIPFKDNAAPSPQVIYEIKQANKSTELWVASFGQGLFLLDAQKKHYIRQYQTEERKPFTLQNNYILSVQKRGNDTLLLGTFGGGIQILQISSGRFSSFTESSGLPNDAVYGLLVDPKGKWWVSTNKGLAMIDPRNQQVVKYDKMEQVQSLEFNEAAYLSDNKGLFYFGGIEGLNVFNPLEIKSSKVPPLVHLTKVTVFDKTLMLNNQSKIVLPHNRNFLGFEFTGIHLQNPDKLRYRYKLEGVDEDWVDAGNRRFVQYTALRFGSYTFRVQAFTDEGLNSANEIIQLIEILPPFWLTWWFISLIVVLSMLLLYMIYKLRTGTIRKAYQVKLTELELKALRSQMNPHFIFNSINSIQYYILNQKPDVAYSYLAKFSSLMRKILQNSRVNYSSLTEEIESLKLYVELENIRLEGEIDFTLTLHGDFNTESLLIPTMILQPFVENSIVHGLLNKKGEKKLIVSIRKEVSHLYCEIEDNGIGREQAKKLNEKRTKKHESTAMLAIGERLELLNKDKEKKLSIHIVDLKDNQGMPLGTKVQVVIPFRLNNES